MDFFDIGDNISNGDLNAIVYLLRKFKRLNEGLRLGNLRLESDYGSFVFDKPLTSIGTNFIIENEINISSSDCLRNCFYTFLFSVIDVNTSGTVNKRQVKVTGNTGENGELFITLPVDLIESDEVLLPDFEVDIVFDEHEYYTPISSLNIDLTVDKKYVLTGESATITATVTDSEDEPVKDLSFQFNINGTNYTKTTDNNGIAEHTYTGTGVGNVNVTVGGQSIMFYDGQPLILKYTGNTIVLGHTVNWVITDGDVIIDWGDGTSTTVNNPYNTYLTHNYTDGEIEHTITFIGTVTKIRNLFYRNNGLTSVILPDTITGLTSAFYGCNNIVDYQLYWQNDVIIQYDKYNMPINSNTVFTIPNGETNNYIAKGYPSDKLFERGYRIYITGDNIIETDETTTLTAQLVDTKTPVTGETLTYVIKQGDTIIDSGSDTTDSNGEITIEYTGASIGKLTLTVTYDTITQRYTIYDTIKYDNGTTTDHKDIWTLSKGTITRTTEYSILKETSESMDAFTSIPNPCIIEFELYQKDGPNSAFFLNFYHDSKTYYRGGVGLQYLNRKILEWVPVRVELDDAIALVTDLSIGRSVTRNLNDSDTDLLSFFGGNGITELWFRNFRVYTGSVGDKIDTSISIQSSKASYYADETITITGALLDENNNPLTSTSVKLYQDNQLIDTLTTDSDGEYSKTLTGLSVGAYTFKAVYDGDTTYEASTSSTLNITVQNHTYSLSVVSDKDILSYADSESATITATLTDNSSPASDETLTYTIKHGTTTITTGSDTTDANGEITITYQSTGIGDVDIIVDFGILLQETYKIEDTLKYDNALSDNTSKYDTTYSTNQTFIYDSNNTAYKLQRSSNGFGTVLVNNLNTPSNVRLSVDFQLYKSTSSLNVQPRLCLFNENNSGLAEATVWGNSTTHHLNLNDVSAVTGDVSGLIDKTLSNFFTNNVWYHLEFIFENGTVTMELYHNGTLIISATTTTTKFTSNNNKVGIQMAYSNGAVTYFKNLKVKAL